MHAEIMPCTLYSTLRDLGPILGLVGVIVGVSLGWLLNSRTASKLLVRQQEQDAARGIIEALVEAQMSFSALSDEDAAREGYERAETEWRRAWLRYAGRLRETELAERVKAVSLALKVCRGLARKPGSERPDDVDWGDLVYILHCAFVNALGSLDAFLKGEKLPPACFPSFSMAMELVVDAPEENKVKNLRAWLNEHPPPKTPRSSHTFG